MALEAVLREHGPNFFLEEFEVLGLIVRGLSERGRPGRRKDGDQRTKGYGAWCSTGVNSRRESEIIIKQIDAKCACGRRGEPAT